MTARSLRRLHTTPGKLMKHLKASCYPVQQSIHMESEFDRMQIIHRNNNKKHKELLCHTTQKLITLLDLAEKVQMK